MTDSKYEKCCVDMEIEGDSSTSGLKTMALNDNKAGMEGLDVNKVNDIIQKASKGSKFYLHKQKCQARIDSRIKTMKTSMDNITFEEVAHAQDEMDKIAATMELTRDLSRIIVHIDMDMFYAAVEMRDDPSLRNKPMAVGSTGMLSTSNYAARKYGIRAGMPGFIALKLYPNLVIVKPNFDKYKKVSQIMKSVFESYDPNFSPMSLDEAYLDITDYADKNNDSYPEDGRSLAERIVEEIRRKVEEKTSLTASAGIAANCRLAKVCSDKNKPNGQYFLPPKLQDIRDFVQDLPARKVSGIGGVTEQLLKALDIEKCSDLWVKRGLIRILFSEISYLHFLSISLGLGSTEVEPSSESDRKSISTESTFIGTSDKKILLKITQDLCDELADDMENKEILGQVFSLKIKTTNFEVKTRAKKLHESVNDAETMANIATRLLQIEMSASKKPLSLRLIGVRMASLCHTSQIDSSKRQRKLTSMLKKETTSTSKMTTRSKYSTNELIASDNEMVSIDDDVICIPQTAIDKSTPKEIYTCPVCSTKTFSCLPSLNDHIDICLNQGIVRNLVQESNNLCSTSTKINIKRPNANSNSSSKKRKVNKKLSKSSVVMHKFVGMKEE